MTKGESLNALIKLGKVLAKDSAMRQAAIRKACAENLWFTESNCIQALNHWSNLLNQRELEEFSQGYDFSIKPKKVGLILAGNIPLVGMHDLVVCILSGHNALVKTSSDDKALMSFVIKSLIVVEPRLKEYISIIERLDSELDAVIATGSNNSFRYFEHYFKDILHVLRKNRKSLAVLSGTESAEELDGLAKDVFDYFGLGCRNISLILLPEGMPIEKVIDHFEPFKYVHDNNRYANNYTYHKALFLMNQQEHLDNGFILIKNDLSLLAPLGCIYYHHYKSEDEVRNYLSTIAEDLQIVEGDARFGATVGYGQGQSPKLQDFADDINTMAFLAEL